MKKLLLILCLNFVALLSFGQKTIKAEDAASHVGDSVVLVGEIFSGRYLPSSKDGVTLLNLGGAYPNQLLTLVVYRANRDAFDEAPEKFYLKKKVEVKGKIQLFNGKPQIILYSQDQIQPIAPVEGE